jgi:hypothetical protein
VSADGLLCVFLRCAVGRFWHAHQRIVYGPRCIAFAVNLITAFDRRSLCVYL